VADRVGLVGLGSMGLGMASNLLRHGVDLVVYDVRANAVEELRSSGARVAGSPAELAKLCDIVLVSVVNEAQVEDVLFGDPEDGVSGAAAAGTIVVVHSTIAPQAVRRIAGLLAAKEIHLVDAPMTGGGPRAAEAGTLTLIVGGEAADVERCDAVFAAVSSRVLHVGAAGTGQIVKLVNNLLAVVNGVAVTEALGLSAAYGLNDQKVLEAINAGTGASYITQNRLALQEMARNVGEGQVSMADMAYKDLNLALACAHEQSLRLPVAAVVTQLADLVFERPY
jgi:2-hydroxy-3-oxopropionate reductase